MRPVRVGRVIGQIVSKKRDFRLEEDVAISLATVSVTRVGFGIVRSERRDEESDTIELEDPTRLIDARG